MPFSTIPFFLFVFGWTWAFHIPLAAVQLPVDAFPGSVLLLAGGLGPSLGALLFVLLRREPDYRREYVMRLTSLTRVSGVCWLAAAALPVTMVLAGVLLSASPVRLDVDVLSGITLFYALLMLLAPLLEEVAWRGYGTDALQSRFGPVRASLLLGSIWWLWHLPLFFMAGTYQNGLGVGTVGFWDFGIFTVATSFVMTWLYNRARGSILAAVVYHFLLNVANELLQTGTTADIARTMVQVGLAVFLLLVLPRLRWTNSSSATGDVWRPASGR